MSNVIEFKKKPEPEAPVEPVEIGPEHYTPEHYRLSDLIRYEYSPETWADRDGYTYQNTLEQHAQLVAFFAAFGFKYDDYAHSAFLAWRTLQAEFVSHVHMHFAHPGTWNIVRNGLDSERIAYVEAVALQDKMAIQRYLHVAQRALDKARSEHEEAANTVQLADIAIPLEATWLERGMNNLDWTGALRYRFPSFEKTSSGQYAIADEGQQGLFVRFAYVCGWSYVDIARDKNRLEEVASICIGTLGFHFVQMVYATGRRWNKSYAERGFAGCSDKLLRYISACHGKRVGSAQKLRDAVWPELQEWARRNPVDRSIFGRNF